MREMDVEMKIDCTGDWDGMDWMDDEEDDGDGSSIFDFFCAAASLSPPLGQLSPSFSLILSRSFFRFFLLSPIQSRTCPYVLVLLLLIITDH